MLRRAVHNPDIEPLVDGGTQMVRDLAGDWREIARNPTLGPDLLAGITVAAVALPLNVALAVAADLPPVTGLVAGALGGAIAAMLGGARFQVTGPAAALNVMVLSLNHNFGPTGVAAATLFTGLMLLVASVARAGRLAAKVPESVLAGFTTGVGLKLLDQQIPEVLGFNYRVLEIAQMMHRPAWLHHVVWIAVICGLVVASVVSATRQFRRFPAAIVSIAVITAVSVYLHWDLERVGVVPSRFPPLRFPALPDERWIDLLVATLPLGLLAGVESLLSARAIDRLAGETRPHNPDLELLGQGAANFVVGLFGGMPVSGVIVRSGVNVQSGARSRLAALFHAVFLAGAVMYLGRYIALVPQAALAGLLCVVGYRLIEVHTFIDLAKRERIEALAFAVTAAGTVSGHLMTGLVAGMLCHAAHERLHRGEDATKSRLHRERKDGLRAVIGREGADARRPAAHEAMPDHHRWLSQIRERAHVSRSAYVHRQASVIGRVVLGDHVHIAAGSSVRADEGSPFFIGSNTNIQDGVVIHALKNQKVRVAGEEWAVYVGHDVSLAHDALVHGPCFIGDGTFVGFKAVVHDAIVGAGCYVGIGAVVVGVELPDRRFVPHGTIVDSADAVARLPVVSEVHTAFNEDVVDVNRGLAAAYRSLEASHRAKTSRRERAAMEPPTVIEPSWGRRDHKDRF